jgi:PAS domain S-box-containing protein
MTAPAAAQSGAAAGADLEYLYRTAPIGLAFIGSDLRYRRINERLAAFNGVPLEQHLGRPIQEVLPDAAPRIVPMLEEVMRTGRPILNREHEAVTVAHNGAPRAYRFSFYPVLEAGRCAGVNCVVEDVTAEKSARDALQTSEERYRKLFETTSDGILIVNSQGIYVDVNPSYCRILKGDRDRLIGAHFSEFIPPDRLQEAEASFQALQAGEPAAIEFPLRALDGSIVELSWTASSSYLPGLYFCVCRDLTERAALHAKEHEARQTAEQLNRVGPALLGELDLQKVVQTITDIATSLVGAEFGAYFYNVVNDRGESYTLYTLSGVPREKFAGFPMPRNTAVFAPTFNGEGVVRSEDITKDPRYGKNPPHYGKPKGHLPVRSYLAAPVVSRSGEVLGGLFFGHSVPGKFTERHEDLITGIAAQGALAMENARLFEQSKRAQSSLERSNRDLEAFAYSASHDLQEPLRNVSIFSQLLERRLGDTADPEIGKFVEGILKGVTRMQHLVQDLLAYAAATKPSEGPVPLVDSELVLATVLQNLKARIENTRIVSGKLPQVHIQEVHLSQILQNIISNALKYRGPDDPEIHVSAALKDGMWTFSVADNGIGIDPRYRTQIFGLFKRLHSRDQYTGSGVGLTICQRIVEQYGGRIWVDSPEPGPGSIFRFTLPA